MVVRLFLVPSAILIGMSLVGCTQSANVPKSADSVTQGSGEAEHSHEGWWCDEHGLPEEVCTQCHARLVAQFKAKGDWCKEHDRPDSQCFVCHPEREVEFAAQYEAKYGKKPPRPDREPQDPAGS